MMTKTMIALAAAIALSAGAALANENADNAGQNAGFRELGSGGVVTDGVNPAYHPSMRGNANNAYGYVPAQHEHTSK
jgi:hypothetical protein